uniref:hypothetical protein n=1 Tax=Actinokineospora sp. CA-119265 TaxID=3239890 RepID=UPI003F498D67
MRSTHDTVNPDDGTDWWLYRTGEGVLCLTSTPPGDDVRPERPVVRESSTPDRCFDGHPLGPNRVLVGWSPCSCPGSEYGGHRTWTCRACLDAADRDTAHRAVIYRGHHDRAGGQWARRMPPPVTG